MERACENGLVVFNVVVTTGQRDVKKMKRCVVVTFMYVDDVGIRAQHGVAEVFMGHHRIGGWNECDEQMEC